jgi:hypothetical protein
VPRFCRRFACLLMLLAPSVLASDENRLEILWADLEKGETEATLALLKLSAQPKEAVDFLKTKMKPLILSSVQLKTLMLKLGNGNEIVWKPALEELEYFDPRLALDLPDLMDRYTETPGRQRMVELMSGRPAGVLKAQELRLMKVADGYNFVVKTDQGSASFWAESRLDRVGTARWDHPKKKWTRAVRAIVLLQYISTPEAKDILKAMATGHPDAYPTRVAKEALNALVSR